jgi:signal transduction histidine kinase
MLYAGKRMHFFNDKGKIDKKLLVTGVGHELKGPLSTIKACTEGLLRRIENNNCDVDLFKDYLGIIDDEVNRCSFIADNLLKNLLDGNENEKREINVHDSFDQILNVLNHHGRSRNIKIVKKYDDRVTFVQWNESEFFQVVLAVITNAIDAMRCEGILTIETRLHLDTIFISINNTGSPILERDLEAIFLPFYTTKALQGGSGLGLFIARNMVNSAGGNIEVMSDEQAGTTFTITLPI